MTRTTKILGVAAALTALSTAPAHAGYYAQAEANAGVRDLTSSSYPTLTNWPFSVSNGSTILGPSIASAQAQNGGTFNNFSLTSLASADLSSGALKAYASTSSSAADPDRLAISFGGAEFGDSFSLSGPGGAPFTWKPGNRASFDLHIDGTLSNASTSTDAPSVWVELGILQHGAVANPAFANSMWLGGFSWQSVQNPDGSLTFEPLVFDGLDMALQIKGSLQTGGVDLHASFQAQGDFDWLMRLSAFSIMRDGSGYQYGDFSHTLTASFTGPTGAQVSSSSGLFPVNAAPVPEPATATLWLAGLAAAGKLAKRRRSRQR